MPRKSRENPVVRLFILNHVTDHKHDISTLTARTFRLSRNSVNGYLRRLEAQGVLTGAGATRARTYALANFVEREFHYEVAPGLAEHRIWQQDIRPLLDGVATNVVDLCRYGITEMVNNVVDHSESSSCRIAIKRNAVCIGMTVEDSGVGIFEKIKRARKLEDARHALLELLKGKLTTDPERHTGEGIFFTSLMFDTFAIHSGTLLYYSKIREGDGAGRLSEVEEAQAFAGTSVGMDIRVDTARTTRQIFDRFTAEDADGIPRFPKTRVPVHLARFHQVSRLEAGSPAGESLARYEIEPLVARSQARRLLARLDQFSDIVFDFQGVTEIGPAFADEIFRVFQREHPEIRIRAENTAAQVSRVLARVEKGQPA